MPYTGDEDEFGGTDETFAYEKYSAEGAGLSCKGCGERICNFTPFCGYCGFKNLAFAHQLFEATFGHSIEQACKEMCTSYWHMTMVESWTHDTSAAQVARNRLRKNGIRPEKLGYCPRCGLELIANRKARDAEIQSLITDLLNT